MIHNSENTKVVNSLEEEQSLLNSQGANNGLILFVASVLFIASSILQIRLSVTLNEWQGVIGQIQVMTSVFLTVRVANKGYKTAIVLNIIMCLMAVIRVVSAKDLHALPGIVIPIGTIVTITIIVFYRNRTRDKETEVKELQITRSKEIIELQEVSIMAMAALAETRDNETGEHIQRTKLYVKVLAEYIYEYQLTSELTSQQMIGLLVASAPLHDIGKVGIPDSILLKPGRLTAEEFEVIKQHTALGNEAILKAERLMGTDETFLKYAQEIILYHHERWDGRGYLNQLKGREIPISARIMSVADVYDALTSKRCYKEVQSHETAISIISEGSGTQFDPMVVDAFLASQETFREIAKTYKEK